jgi:myo-inositol-1(or 4)-monophosphatase
MHSSAIRDLDRAQRFLEALLPAAGEILLKHFTERTFAQKQKEGVDFTTQADAEADVFLREALAREFPASAFLTEETAPPDYSALSDADDLWVIDPLDGTINFSRGTPHFAISVAWVARRQTRIGAIYNPNTREFFHARVDQPHAYKNGKPIRVSQTPTLREATIACDWGWDLPKRQNVIRALDALAPHVRQIKSMGSAVADLAQVAEGRIDAYIHSGLKPWDVAAAGLLIEKAGGIITTPNGNAWNIFHGDLLAATPTLHAQILRLLTDERQARKSK